MLQAAYNDPFVPIVHKSDVNNLPFPLSIKPAKVDLNLNWRIFILCTLDTDGLKNTLGPEVGF